ncbi:unnamed protein product [Brassicogethes aeneus]|uniref:TTF-type domain-containing protein n=1 Tax=Brassicogethes aeneus TaxID=1431903 RepID=A0A9P0FFK6_BRAAE|nr:unnamed protein product [Brassicogethes aeneus]
MTKNLAINHDTDQDLHSMIGSDLDITEFVFPSASTSFSVPDTILEKDIKDTVDTSSPVEMIHENLIDNQDKSKNDDKKPCDRDQDTDQDLHSMIGSDLEIADPASWKNLNDSQHQIIIEKGPIQVKGIDFPKDDSGRHFSDLHYYRIISNGENVDRSWLIYSKRDDAVFCFRCLLFKNSDLNAKNWSRGYKDWKNIHRNIWSALQNEKKWKTG